jgi:hypothetical protein
MSRPLLTALTLTWAHKEEAKTGRSTLRTLMMMMMIMTENDTVASRPDNGSVGLDHAQGS